MTNQTSYIFVQLLKSKILKNNFISFKTPEFIYVIESVANVAAFAEIIIAFNINLTIFRIINSF